MIRRTTSIWLLLSLAAAVWMFVVKHQVQSLEDELQHLQRAIVEEQETIHVLSAEWSYLNSPARLDGLGRRLMGLSDMAADQQTDLRGLRQVLEGPATSRDDELRLPPGLRLDAAAQAGDR